MKLNKIVLVLNILTLIGLICVFCFYYRPIRKNAYVPKEKYYVDTLTVKTSDGELCNITIVTNKEFLFPSTYELFKFIGKTHTKKQLNDVYGGSKLTRLFHHDDFHHDEILKAYID